MPTPLDEVSERTGVIGWLRVIAEEDSGGVVAALFEASLQGEPLGFCFTRAGFGDAGTGVSGFSEAVPALLATLLRAASLPPSLLVGQAAEIPPAPVAAAMEARVPFCLLGPPDRRRASDGSNGRGTRPTWMTPAPPGDTGAARLLEEILASADPLEPFERAAEGLREAFRRPARAGAGRVGGAGDGGQPWRFRPPIGAGGTRSRSFRQGRDVPAGTRAGAPRIATTRSRGPRQPSLTASGASSGLRWGRRASIIRIGAAT